MEMSSKELKSRTSGEKSRLEQLVANSRRYIVFRTVGLSAVTYRKSGWKYMPRSKPGYFKI